MQLKYLGFPWGRKGRKKFDQFTVLPFDLAFMCYSLAKVLRPLLKVCLGKGVNIVVYLVDGIGAAL